MPYMHEKIAPPNTSQQLNSIQILRGIAALAVVAMHVRWNLHHYRVEPQSDLFLDNGGSGVYLFFVLSGFIIAHATRRKQSATEYTLRRVLRIFPLYYAVLAAIVALAFMAGTLPALKDIFKSIFLLPANPYEAGPYYGYPIVLVSWTLTYEVFFYGIFLVAMAINHRLRSLIASCALVALSYFGQILVFGDASLAPNLPSIGGLGYWQHLIFAINPIMLNFVLGMLAEFIYSQFNEDNEALKTAIRDISPLVIIISCWGFLTYGDWLGPLGWGLPSFTLLLSVVLLEKTGVSFNFRWFVYLGTISYSIYLTHPVVIEIVKPEYFSHFWQTGYTKFFAVIFLTIAVSHLTYKYIESWVQKAAKALTTPSQR